VTKVSLLPDRVVCKIGGAEAQDFLQNLLTNNLDRVSSTRAIYTLLQTPQGKYLFDFFIVEHEGHYLIDCDRTAAPDLLKRLMFYKLRADVTLASLGDDWVVGAIWDTDATNEPGTTGPLLSGVQFQDPRLALLGSRFFVPAGDADAALSGHDSGTTDEFDAHRIGHGVPGSADLISDKTFPMEANLDLLNAIDFQKGCFVGQEVTSRTHRKGQVRKRILPVTASRNLPAAHTPVMAGDRQAGELLSSNGARGLALLRLDRLSEGLVAEDVELTPEFPDWMQGELKDGAAL
jgi:tRNA-modifying protein YgfZ